MQTEPINNVTNKQKYQALDALYLLLCNKKQKRKRKPSGFLSLVKKVIFVSLPSRCQFGKFLGSFVASDGTAVNCCAWFYFFTFGNLDASGVLFRHARLLLPPLPLSLLIRISSLELQLNPLHSGHKQIDTGFRNSIEETIAAHDKTNPLNLSILPKMKK